LWEVVLRCTLLKLMGFEPEAGRRMVVIGRMIAPESQTR